VSEDLDDAARERADAVRQKRHERADPEDRIRRVQAQSDPPDDLDLELPEADTGGDVELPEAVRTEFEEIRKKVAYGLEQEFGVEMEADAHYWPLVVHLGVKRLKGMWLEEVRHELEHVEGIDAPEES
jgi:hypothetical protein